MTEPVTADPVEREGLVRRGRMLAWFTIVWNAIEGVAGIAAGIAAGSIALIGFGVDSYVEVFAGSVIIWRLSKERHGEAVSEAAEQRAVRLIALTFLFLAVGVGVESIRRLASGERPDESWFGIGLAVVSLVVMPLLAGRNARSGNGSVAGPSPLTPLRRCCASGSRRSCWWASAPTRPSVGGGPTPSPPSVSSTSPLARASSTGGPRSSTTAADPASSVMLVA